MDSGVANQRFEFGGLAVLVHESARDAAAESVGKGRADIPDFLPKETYGA